MHGMPTTEEIVKSIDAQLKALAREAQQLRGARAALEDGPSAPRPKRKRAARRNANSKTEAVPTGKLLKLVNDHPGSSTSQLAALANGDQAQILVLLREAETNRNVRRSGARRGTRWHSYTDEDKIAERAAQLERQLKPRK